MMNEVVMNEDKNGYNCFVFHFLEYYSLWLFDLLIEQCACHYEILSPELRMVPFFMGWEGLDL